MSSRKCFVYCNDCNGYITHDNTEHKPWNGKSCDKRSVYCGSCKTVVDYNKHDYQNDKKCCDENNYYQNIVKNNYDDDHHNDKHNDNHHDNHRDNHYENRFKCKPILKCKPIKCRPVCHQPCPPIHENCGLAETLISVRDPTTDIFATSPQFVDLTGWTDNVIDARDSFDNFTGTYTARCAGDYEVDLVLNYRTSFPVTVDTGFLGGAGITAVNQPDPTAIPRIELYDVATGRVLAASQFPTDDVIIPVPAPSTGEPPIDIEVKTIVGAAAVVIDVVVPLVAGQRIRLRFNYNGLILPVPLPVPISTPVFDLSAPGSSTDLSIKKIRNTPVVTIVV